MQAESVDVYSNRSSLVPSMPFGCIDSWNTSTVSKRSSGTVHRSRACFAL